MWWWRGDHPRDHGGRRCRRRDLDPGLHAGEPADPGATPTRSAVATSSTPSPPSWCTTTPTRRRRRTTSPSRSRPTRQQELHRQAEAGLQVPGRHRRQGQELRRRLELHRVRPERPGLNTYFFSPIEGYADVQCGPTPTARPTARADAEGREDVRPEGRRRHHLHHQDHRARSPTSRCGSATRRSRRCPTRSSRTRRPSRTKPIGAGPFKVDRATPTTEIVLSKFADYSGDEQAERRQGDLPDLPATTAPRTPTSWPTTSTSPTPSRPTSWSATPTRPTCRTATASGRPARSPIIVLAERHAVEGQRRAAQGHLDGHRPGPDRQADLQRHRDPGRPAGSPRWWTATRPASAVTRAPSTPPRPRQLYEEAGGYKGTLTIDLNADGGHKAVGRGRLQLDQEHPRSRVRGEGDRRLRDLQQPDRQRETEGHVPQRLADGLPVDRELPGPDLRQGRRLQLTPKYRQPGLRRKLAEAAAATSADEANTLYQEAEAMLAEDFPTDPDVELRPRPFGWSTNVTDVKLNAVRLRWTCSSIKPSSERAFREPAPGTTGKCRPAGQLRRADAMLTLDAPHSPMLDRPRAPSSHQTERSVQWAGSHPPPAADDPGDPRRHVHHLRRGVRAPAIPRSGAAASDPARRPTSPSSGPSTTSTSRCSSSTCSTWATWCRATWAPTSTATAWPTSWPPAARPPSSWP